MSYQDMMAFERETAALGQIAERLGWDQEAIMPEGAAPQRSEEMAAMEAVLHARRTDPRLGDWIAALEGESLDPVAAANLREISRSFARNTKVPAKLAAEIARVTSLAQGIWAEARANEDFDAFAPTLERVLELRREEADALSGGGDRYDALLQDYEPGTTAAEIKAIFDGMRPRTVALLDRVRGAAHQPASLSGTYVEVDQMTLGRELAGVFGYDFNHGRIDKVVHPFCSGGGLDVRITTRTSESDPFNCLYSTIHEVGHAAYEQGIDSSHLLTPIGRGVSMGVHESQSRIYENQIGRSRAFTGWMFGRMQRVFGDFGIADSDAFYGTVNKVREGFIRTEADELQYNLHIMLRFDIEQALIAGDLQVADLPDAWNDRFAADFGFAVDQPSNGCLQDVHWSVGLMGYFPTYSLGNVYAGCLNQAMRAALPDLDQDFARGDTSAATGWLRENLQQFGGLRTPRETIEHACGFAPSEGPLLDYLEEKFSAIYRL